MNHGGEPRDQSGEGAQTAGDVQGFRCTYGRIVVPKEGDMLAWLRERKYQQARKITRCGMTDKNVQNKYQVRVPISTNRTEVSVRVIGHAGHCLDCFGRTRTYMRYIGNQLPPSFVGDPFVNIQRFFKSAPPVHCLVAACVLPVWRCLSLEAL